MVHLEDGYRSSYVLHDGIEQCADVEWSVQYNETVETIDDDGLGVIECRGYRWVIEYGTCDGCGES